MATMLRVAKRLLPAVILSVWALGALPLGTRAGGSTLYLPLVAKFGGAVVTHGQQLTRAHVGPEAIGITSFPVTYPGGAIYDGQAYPFIQSVNGPRTYDGFYVDGPHLLIEGKRFTGSLDFYTTGRVVIRGSVIRPVEGGYWGVHFRGQKVWVLYSSIGSSSTAGAPDDPTHQIEGAIRGQVAGGVFYRNFLSMACNMIEIGGSHVQIIENLLDEFVYYTDAHLDGIQSGGGDEDYQILRNKILLFDGQTGAISLFQDWGVSTNFRIDSNYLAGGGYTFYGGGGNLGQSTYITFTNNIFGRDFWPNSGYWGPVAYWDTGAAGNVWSNNRFADGAVIPEP